MWSNPEDAVWTSWRTMINYSHHNFETERNTTQPKPKKKMHVATLLKLCNSSIQPPMRCFFVAAVDQLWFWSSRYTCPVHSISWKFGPHVSCFEMKYIFRFSSSKCRHTLALWPHGPTGSEIKRNVWANQESCVDRGQCSPEKQIAWQCAVKLTV